MSNLPANIQSMRMGEVDLSNPEFSGWLYKQSAWMKQWRRRHFVLKGARLFYCVNQGDTPHGEIDLKTAVTVMSADDKAGRPHSIEIRLPNTSFLLSAESDQQRSDWISALGRAIVRSGNMYDDENPDA